MAEVPSTPFILSPKTPVNSEYSIVEVSPYHEPVIVYPAKATPLPPLLSQESPRMNKVSFPANTHKIIGELVGTFVLIYAGCGSGLVNKRGSGNLMLVGMAVVWGLVLMVMVYTLGHVSGAHFNPAVTIALATSQKFPWKQELYILSYNQGYWYLHLEFVHVELMGLTIPKLSRSRSTLSSAIYLNQRVSDCCSPFSSSSQSMSKLSIDRGLKIVVPAYIVAQVGGSTLACLVLNALFSRDGMGPTLTLPQKGISPLDAIIWEFIITFFLMFVVCGVATDERAINELSGVAIGATVLFNVLIAGPVTGASMNPARSLGPAIVAKNFDMIWIYIFAPTLGAIAASVIYRLLRVLDKSESEVSKTV